MARHLLKLGYIKPFYFSLPNKYEGGGDGKGGSDIKETTMKKFIGVLSVLLAGSAYAAVSSVSAGAIYETGMVILFVTGLVAIAMIRSERR